jgi:hypothetical protein
VKQVLANRMCAAVGRWGVAYAQWDLGGRGQRRVHYLGLGAAQQHVPCISYVRGWGVPRPCPSQRLTIAAAAMWRVPVRALQPKGAASLAIMMMMMI